LKIAKSWRDSLVAPFFATKAKIGPDRSIRETGRRSISIAELSCGKISEKEGNKKRRSPNIPEGFPLEKKLENNRNGSDFGPKRSG